MEPIQLSEGKLFHQKIQSEWSGTIESMPVHPEYNVKFLQVLKQARLTRQGRIDLFVDQMDDFITIIEIKSTNWDMIKKQNVKKLLGSHKRQILRYVDEYINRNTVNVCAAILYAKPPVTAGLKEEIEKYLNDFSLQVAWFEY